MVCHSVEQKMVRFIKELLVVKVMTMAKEVRLTGVVVLLTGLDIHYYILFMDRLAGITMNNTFKTSRQRFCIASYFFL